MTEPTSTTTKKTKTASDVITPELKKVRKTKEFKPVHCIVIPLSNNEGIYRVKWGVEKAMSELVEATSAYEAAQKTNHSLKLGEGFVDFLISMSGMISGDLTIVQFDAKSKEYKIVFESVKPEPVHTETKPWNESAAMTDG